MVLREEASVVVKPQSSDSKTIMWTCNVSAPEMTIVLYDMVGSPLYHQRLVWIGGKKDMESSEEDGPRCRLGLLVDVTGMGIYLTFKRVASLISTAISFQALLKSLSASKKKLTPSHGHLAKPSGKGTQLLKFNLERCSVYVWGESGLENTIVPDPKRVNYGSQGGRVIIDVSADGTPRNANIMSTISDEHQKLQYSVSLEIFQFNLCVDKEKQSTQMELERARSVYQEYMEENRPVTKLKLLVHKCKLQEHGNEHTGDVSHVRDANWKQEGTIESGHIEKQKKKESIFAVDVEMLSISAGLGDGVDAMIQVQSIFSENARIGVLLEGLMLSFNGARIFKSSRMQISRIPSVSTSASDAKGHVVTTWDWLIQGLDVHICMPYRLQLRAIDDVIEDMLRGLKLIIAAKTNLIFPMKKESSKVKKPSSVQFGCIKFCIRKLTADIEEEPIQGWLDEHYQLLKKEAGSGACGEDFQAGFKPSTSRTSLLSISALDLDLRNYTFPLFSGSCGKCDGRLVLAQQATSFQPQIYQDIYVGRWRKVRMLRSASGTTPPMKTYSDLPIHFQKGEVSFGVGYEPAFADVSYAFMVALRRANLSVRHPGPLLLPPKKGAEFAMVG
ncbi:FMP27, GFWDK domain [Sesbania bispinosa]|nr:FMP27, GFWDK domain [Sesbania bispinosa]